MPTRRWGTAKVFNTDLLTILDCVSDALMVVDRSNDCTFVNEAFCKLAGFDNPAEATEKNLKELLFFPGEESVAQTLQESMDGLKRSLRKGQRLRIGSPDAAERTVELRIKPLVEKQEGVGYLFSIRDITQQYRAEQALRQSEERLSLAARELRTGCGMSISSRATRGTRIASSSCWGCRNRRQFSKAGVQARLHPEDRAAAAEAMEEHIQKGTLYHHEFRFRHESGHYRWFLARGKSIRDPEGRAVRMAGFLQDVTERRNWIERLTDSNNALMRMSTELQKKNEEVEAFVYIVSHDLRAPLVNLQGFSKELRYSTGQLSQLILRAEIPAEIRAEIQTLLELDIPEAIGFIEAGTKKFEGLIDALLQLSRTGRQEYLMKELDLNAIAHDTAKALEALAQEKQAEITVGELPRVYADATAVSQVLSNLLANALKYSSPKQTPRIEIRGEKEGDWVQISVKDNGLGISVDSQQKVFQVFRRAHPAVASGEGMGLAIVRLIVERHGGKTWVESQENVGSTFFSHFPHLKRLRVRNDGRIRDHYR